MELKLGNSPDTLRMVALLLIVPYGIETHIGYASLGFCNILLIVPYGIETCLNEALISISYLLIVPYGIETSKVAFAQ